MPQSYPVIIQAGQFEDGNDFAAEVIFASGSSLEKACDFDREIGSASSRRAGRWTA